MWAPGGKKSLGVLFQTDKEDVPDLRGILWLPI